MTNYTDIFKFWMNMTLTLTAQQAVTVWRALHSMYIKKKQ